MWSSNTLWGWPRGANVVRKFRRSLLNSLGAALGGAPWGASRRRGGGWEWRYEDHASPIRIDFEKNIADASGWCDSSNHICSTPI